MQRLVEQRGMPEADARARIAAQADDAARRAAADVWLDNSGDPAGARGGGRRAVGPAAGTVRGEPRGRPVRARPHRRSPTRTRTGPRRPHGSSRGSRRRRGSGAGASRTSARPPVPGLPAADVLELQLGAARPPTPPRCAGRWPGVRFRATGRSDHASAPIPAGPPACGCTRSARPAGAAPSACGTGCGPSRRPGPRTRAIRPPGRRRPRHGPHRRGGRRR